MSALAVLGGGSWGTALAVHLSRVHSRVRLWVRDPASARDLLDRRENRRYLPGIELSPGIDVVSDLEQAAHADVLVVAVPSEFCRDVYRRVAPFLPTQAIVVSATKGFEIETLLRMSQVASEQLPGRRLAVLSGPSFALEVAQGQPTAVVVASADLEVAEEVQRAVSNSTLRAYSSDDVVGVEVAGALKNVIAIASGIVGGLAFGHNTVAALITRGLAEISRLAGALGGRPDTLAGLAGLGDLVLTCTGGLSRNRRLGQELGRGRTLEEALASTSMVAEGVRTTLAACALARRAGAQMPIAEQMRAVLYEGKPPRAAVEELMQRSLKRE